MTFLRNARPGVVVALVPLDASAQTYDADWHAVMPSTSLANRSFRKPFFHATSFEILR